MAGPILCEQFVGRAKELDLVFERFRLARTEGRGSIVVLRGDAGIGKSRFLLELRRRLEAEGVAVLTGECLDYARAPLGPFVDVFEQLAQLEPGASSAYQGLVAPSIDGQRDDASAKRRQFIAIATALRGAAQQHPYVVALEDLHWADHATLELVLFLSSKVGTAPLLLVATYRGDEMHRHHPLSAPLSRIIRAENVFEVPLQPLTATEMHALVREALHGREIDPHVGAEIMRLAEGNPLFAEELLRNVLEGAAHGDASVPASLRDVVLARLNLLADEDQHLLVRAAVLGREFGPALLAAIAASPIEDLRGVLKRARNLQLIDESPGGTYRFRHELTREALSGELLAEERRALHAIVAEQLEAQPSDHTAELAYHWWAAGEPVKAMRYNVAAGDAAIAVCAFNDAAVLYERAIDFLREPSRERAEIREKIAEASFHAGSARVARRHFERALTDYDSLEDREAIARICERIAYQAYWSCDGDRCLHWCERAAEAIRAVPTSTRSRRVLAYVARVLGILGDLPRSLAYLEEADRAPEASTLDDALYVELAHGLSRAMMGDATGAIVMLQRTARTAGGAADTQVVVHGNLALVAMEFGDDAIAATTQDEGLRLAREYRLPARELYILGQRAEMHLRRGELLRALSTIHEALPLRDIVDFPGYMYAKLAAVSLRLGLRLRDREVLDVFDAGRMLESSFSSKGAEFIAEMGTAWAEKLIDEERRTDAAEVLRRAVDAVGDGISRAPLLVMTAAHGRSQDVARAHESLVRWTRFDTMVGRAQLALFEAYVARRKEDRAIAGARAMEAAALFATLTRPYEHAQALELAGRVVDAHALYASTGDVRDTERLRPLAMGINRRGRAKDDLTPREREVSALVAIGKSNRAIASELVISERTVEKHLESILAKVGVSSRTELAVQLGNAPRATSR